MIKKLAAKWGKLAAAIAGACILALGGYSFAQASIPAADGSIHGCMSPGSASFHELSVIDPDSSGSCPSGWTSLNWSPGFAGVHYVTLTWNQKCGLSSGNWAAYGHEESLPSGVRGVLVSAYYTSSPSGQDLAYGTNTGTNPANNVVVSPTDPTLYHTDSSGNIDGLNVIGRSSAIYSDQASCEAVSYTNKVLVYTAP